jgi:hypothetical protein
MRSALEATFIACLFAFAAGCSSADGGSGATTDHGSTGDGSSDSAASPALSGQSTASLQEELRGRRRPRPTNPCAAASCPTNTSCEVVDGQAVCTPLDPAPFCGGFAGIACPGSGTCVDDPNDGCDPERGGADCGGLCECNVRALCVRGLVFDASPEVCACVPQEPPVDACASVRCRAGTHCEVVDDRAQCIVDEQVNPCAAVLCPAPSTCDVVDGQAVCTPIEEPNPCAAASCPTNTSCDVLDGQAECKPLEPAPYCVGFAGIACPGSGTCVDDPSDGCDPERGGADCGGVCECNVRALCVRGLVFDPSPSVCACVPQEPVNPCAAVLCPAPSTCEVVDGQGVCTPIETTFCGGIAAFPCPGSGTCVDNPSDGCDPERGGADCGGICECNIRALCVPGLVFDPSPSVCACVPVDDGSPKECSAEAAE